MKPFSRPDRSLLIYTPLLLPPYGTSWKKSLNTFLLQWQIRFLQKALGFQNPIVWIENPVGITLAKLLKPSLVLYYQIDKYECHHELRDRQEIATLEERLTREADLILCVSLKLYEEKLALRKEGVHYVPHGVDVAHFYKATKPLPLPEDLKGIGHPMVGYFGTLDAKNDPSIIRYCATRRPDISFVLIGEVSDKQEEIQNLPNVHFLGFKEYKQLPNYGRAFDVCMMFWKINDWIQYCHPVKTMEFLAMGKPVVSVEFNEMKRKYAGVVTVACSQEEFLKKIEEEIAYDSKERQQARLDFVRNETWEARAEYISRIIAVNGHTPGHSLQSRD
jgi:glycosyltransferase involved in cell wall biosynthesis